MCQSRPRIFHTLRPFLDAGRWGVFLPLSPCGAGRTQLCALGLDCPYYADPDQP